MKASALTFSSDTPASFDSGQPGYADVRRVAQAPRPDLRADAETSREELRRGVALSDARRGQSHSEGAGRRTHQRAAETRERAVAIEAAAQESGLALFRAL